MLNWLEISKSALIHNLKEFRKIIGPKIKLMAVVKSNAYGHGIEECARIFEKAGADYFGVIDLEEALFLRKSGLKKPIFILSYWSEDKNKIKQAINKDIEFPVYTYPQAKILSQIGRKMGKRAKIHLKIDTGTSRIGILPQNALNFTLECSKLPGLIIKGIFSHFAKSEAANQKYTLLQAKRLKEIGEEIIQTIQNIQVAKNLSKIQSPSVLNLLAIATKSKTLIIPFIHGACTAATIVNPKTHFDMVRIGIGLYGLWPSEENKKLAKSLGVGINLKPALTWKTKVIQVKDLSAGTPIGYDCTYHLKRKGKIAILPVGYWDGYDRRLSNSTSLKIRGMGCGEVLIRGQRAPIRGRVCMNLIMVETTKIFGVKVGDEAVLIGRQEKEEITAEEMATKINTINYEIVTRINPLLPRIYK